MEDSREVDIKQAEADKDVKNDIWKEKEEKSEAANTAKEIVTKSWRTAEDDKTSKYSAVATTEAAAQVAEGEAAVLQRTAGQLEAWVRSLGGRL